MKQEYKEFKEKFDPLVSESRQIYITSHINPDGDAISSVLLMYYYITEVLKVRSSKVSLLFTGPQDDNWSYFWNYKKLKFVDDISNIVETNSTLIMLDGKELYRFTNNEDKLRLIKDLKTVCVDHHSSPDSEGYDLSYTVEDTAHTSCAEILYSMFLRKQLKSLPNEICELALLGMYTDSGGFKYVEGKLTDCMFFSAEIIKEKNIKPDRFLSTLYKPEIESLKAESDMLKNLQVLKVGDYPKGVVTYITKSDAKKYSKVALRQAAGSMKDRIKYVKGVSWSFMYRPELDEAIWKFSFRSIPNQKKQLNVKDICLAFGGGGHNAAAGLELKGSSYWELSEKEVLDKIVTHLKNTSPTYI